MGAPASTSGQQTQGYPCVWSTDLYRRCAMTLLVERRGPVTLLTLNRPDVHTNVDAETAVALSEAIDRFTADDYAATLVVTDAADKAFCAGADLKGVERRSVQPAASDP